MGKRRSYKELSPLTNALGRRERLASRRVPLNGGWGGTGLRLLAEPIALPGTSRAAFVQGQPERLQPSRLARLGRRSLYIKVLARKVLVRFHRPS
jgi:hypothetical protein